MSTEKRQRTPNQLAMDAANRQKAIHAKELGISYVEYLKREKAGTLPTSQAPKPTTQAPVTHNTPVAEVNARDMSTGTRNRAIALKRAIVESDQKDLDALEQAPLSSNVKEAMLQTQRIVLATHTAELDALLYPDEETAEEELQTITNTRPHRQAEKEPVQREHRFVTTMPNIHDNIVPPTGIASRKVHTDKGTSNGATITHTTRTVKPATETDFATIEMSQTVDQELDPIAVLKAEYEAKLAALQQKKAVAPKLAPLPGTACGSNVSYTFDEKTGIVSFHMNTYAPDIHPTKAGTGMWVAEMDNSLQRLNGVRFSVSAFRKAAK